MGRVRGYLAGAQGCAVVDKAYDGEIHITIIAAVVAG